MLHISIFRCSFGRPLRIILFKPMALSLFLLMFSRIPVILLSVSSPLLPTNYSSTYSIDEPPSLVDKSHPSPLCPFSCAQIPAVCSVIAAYSKRFEEVYPSFFLQYFLHIYIAKRLCFQPLLESCFQAIIIVLFPIRKQLRLHSY